MKVNKIHGSFIKTKYWWIEAKQWVKTLRKHYKLLFVFLYHINICEYVLSSDFLNEIQSHKHHPDKCNCSCTLYTRVTRVVISDLDAGNCHSTASVIQKAKFGDYSKTLSSSGGLLWGCEYAWDIKHQSGLLGPPNDSCATILPTGDF